MCGHTLSRYEQDVVHHRVLGLRGLFLPISISVHRREGAASRTKVKDMDYSAQTTSLRKDRHVWVYLERFSSQHGSLSNPSCIWEVLKTRLPTLHFQGGT
jgi:hypothetical protein